MNKAEELYQDYLKRVNLDESKMPIIQQVETKRAFMAGIASTMILIKSLCELSDLEGATVMQNLENEVLSFWLKQENAS